jgi:putative Holliday junction resolvase
MDSKRVYIGLDVGGQRIGIAVGDSIGRIAQPLQTVPTDQFGVLIRQVLQKNDVTDVVVGRPRNQSGEPTAQTAVVEQFVRQHVEPLGPALHWQDESVTSVIAEERLKVRKKSYTKGDIDAEAAAIILQDYLEQL